MSQADALTKNTNEHKKSVALTNVILTLVYEYQERMVKSLLRTFYDKRTESGWNIGTTQTQHEYSRSLGWAGKLGPCLLKNPR